LFADYVYFENSSSNPYLIRRIEELNKVSEQCGITWPTPKRFPFKGYWVKGPRGDFYFQFQANYRVLQASEYLLASYKDF
jgi:hypothetical protein